MGQSGETIYSSWRRVWRQRTVCLNGEDSTANIDDKFVFLVGPLGLVGGTADIVSECAIEGVFLSLHFRSYQII